MSVTESMLKKGTLVFGADDAPVLTVSCQATAVSLEPEFDEAGDAVEVLCGDSLSAATKTAWTLKFTGIQDFSDPKGFVNFAYDHDGESQPFTWKASEDGPSWAGVVNVRALVIGGDVGTRITSDAEWPCNGKPVRTDPPKSDAAPGKRS